MSLLSQEIHAELTQLLQALQSPDNGIRSQAEEHLQNNWTATRPEVLLMGLAEQAQVVQDAGVSLPHSLRRTPPLTPRRQADRPASPPPSSRHEPSPPSSSAESRQRREK